jgi:hypothetical protein
MWADLEATGTKGSTMARNIREQDLVFKEREKTWTEHEKKVYDNRAYADLTWKLLHDKPDEAKASYTKDQFKADMTALAPGASTEVRNRAVDEFDKWMKESGKANIEPLLKTIMTEELERKFPGGDGRYDRDKKAADLHAYLRDGVEVGYIPKTPKALRDEARAYLMGQRGDDKTPGRAAMISARARGNPDLSFDELDRTGGVAPAPFATPSAPAPTGNHVKWGVDSQGNPVPLDGP